MQLPTLLSLAALFTASLLSSSSALSAAEITRRDQLPAPDARTAVKLAAEHPAAGDLVIAPDAAALAGRYLRVPQGYRPMIFGSLPPEGDPLLIWVRYRAAALQMKILEGDAQRETPWNWDTKDAFGWRSLGPFSREFLSDGILFIGAPTDNPAAGIDALVITADPAIRPDGGAALPGMPNVEDATVKLQSPPPPESSEPGAATITIDWDHPGRVIPTNLFSINSFVGFEPHKLAVPDYAKNFAHINPGLVRFHHAGMLARATDTGAGWFDPDTQTWAWEKIRRAVALWPATGQRLVNICGWPDAWDKNRDHRLDLDRHADFARLCADLVRFLNHELGARVTHWEITNEKDGGYWVDPSRSGKDHVDELASLYRLAAAAVRQVDPTAKIGGPAAMRPDFYSHLERFARATLPELDFLSIHAYASGVLSESDQSIYDKTAVMAAHAEKLAHMLRSVSPERPIELHLNEWNISWTWETQEPRMVNHKGAVFDALALAAFAHVDGLHVTNAWNDMDGTYGKMNHDASLRPSAHVFHHLNARFRGALVSTASDAPSRVVAFAVVPDAKGRSLALINRTNGIQTVTLEGDFAGDWQHATIDASGHRVGDKRAAFTSPLELPPHSVSFFWRE